MRKNFTIIISLMLLFYMTLSSSFASQLEDKYWIENRISSYIYSNPTLSTQLKIKYSQYALLNEYDSKVYKLSFESGQVGYMSSEVFNELIKHDYEYILTESQRKALGTEYDLELNRKKVQMEKEEKDNQAKIEADLERLRKEKSEIKSKLKANGIYENKTVWLKYPNYDLPGLTRFKILDIDISLKELYFEPKGQRSSYAARIGGSNIINLQKENGTYTYEMRIILYVDSDYESDKIECNDVNEVISYFALKNPGAKWGKKALGAIEKGRVYIGMTKDQVRASVGRPSEINRTGGVWGVHEQWVYGSGFYLYFENGKLTSWQD